MIRLFVLDIPENSGLLDVAGADEAIEISPVGPYFALAADHEIIVDRRATGMRHAVWYSSVAATSGCTITQWDKDALRLEAT